MKHILREDTNARALGLYSTPVRSPFSRKLCQLHQPFNLSIGGCSESVSSIYLAVIIVISLRSPARSQLFKRIKERLQLNALFSD